MSARVMLSELFPPASKFSPERDIPDMSGRVVIVTGGNSGIGKDTVKHLLVKNAKVYMASRSKNKADQAISDLKTETGKEAIFLQIDLGSLASVTRAAEEFKSKESALHVLFNSGGIMLPPVDQLTTDGYDLQMGTNFLAHAHLTLCLLDVLIAGGGRTVFTSSNAAYSVPKQLPIDYETVKGDNPKRKKRGSFWLYNQSKWAVYAFSCELAKRYPSITSNALHPGVLKTNLQTDFPLPLKVMVNIMGQNAKYGSYTQLYAGTSSETANITGKWFVPWAREAPFPGPPYTDAEGKKLWEWVEAQRQRFL